MLLTLILGLSLSGCGGRSGPVVAVVNGVRLTAAELGALLPQGVDSVRLDEVRRKVVDDWIARELFVQEAERTGLDSLVSYQVEREQQGLVIHELMRRIAMEVTPVTDRDVETAYRLMLNVVRCRMIAANDSASALEVERALARGEQFESLAARYSVHPSANAGGQVREITEYEIDEPLRSRVARLGPGERTPVTPFDGGYVIVQLDERVPVESVPEFGTVRQRIKAELELVRRRAAAQDYAERLRQRLVFNPEGLAILRRPVDSISDAEKEVWVAIKDSTQYVKVGRLLHIARRFPPRLDTVLANYAIRRAIEEDMMYEEGLRRGLERLPSVRAELAKTRRRLLYEALYRREVAGRVTVGESDVEHYYAAHSERYPGGLTPDVAGLISGQLREERQRARLAEFTAELRARSRVSVSEKALGRVKPEKKQEEKGR